MRLPFADGSGPLPDSIFELLFILVVAGLVAGGSFLYVQQNPAAPWQLEAAVSNLFSTATTVNESTTLTLPQEDAEYLNRAYRDLNMREGDRVGEQAYCIDLIENRMSVQQAGTLEAREDRVRFTLDNCLFEPDAVAHFHPLGSDPVLSGPDTAVNGESNDKDTFLQMENIQISCVQAGAMTTEPGERTQAFRCYRKPATGDIDDPFPEVPVVIESTES